MDKIEITPEMIEAALPILRQYDWEPGMSKEEAITGIVLAALSRHPSTLGPSFDVQQGVPRPAESP
jgi:hypothetical protein